jgi:CBS domain-containing protein
MAIPKQLQDAAARVEKGEAPEASVRKLLEWFGAARRGVWVVERVRAGLKEAKLLTVPDFESAWIDQPVVFQAVKEAKKPDKGMEAAKDLAPPVHAPDPVPRLGNLAAASRAPVTVPRDAEIATAVTEMLMRDYSQLPVMNGDRQVLGMISWRTIGRASVSAPGAKHVRQCMDKDVRILATSVPLFTAINEIIAHDVVLVRDHTEKIVGIVTAADVSEEYRRLSESFLLIGEIENHIRRLIDSKFSVAELQAPKDPGDVDRKVQSAADLTFGEYVRLLENQAAWDKIELNLDRARVVGRLREVGRVRNDVMHFDPDGVSHEDIELLKNTAAFMREVISARA